MSKPIDGTCSVKMLVGLEFVGNKRRIRRQVEESTCRALSGYLSAEVIVHVLTFFDRIWFLPYPSL